MDPERLRWLRELIRSIPGYERARRVPEWITDTTEAGIRRLIDSPVGDVSQGIVDATQSFGTRTAADVENIYNVGTFLPESDFFGELEEDTARRLAEEDRNWTRKGAQIGTERSGGGTILLNPALASPPACARYERP